MVPSTKPRGRYRRKATPVEEGKGWGRGARASPAEGRTHAGAGRDGKEKATRKRVETGGDASD